MSVADYAEVLAGLLVFEILVRKRVLSLFFLSDLILQGREAFLKKRLLFVGQLALHSFL